MSKILLCDKCGKECKQYVRNGGYYKIAVVREDGAESDHEICRSCWDNFVFSFKRKGVMSEPSKPGQGERCVCGHDLASHTVAYPPDQQCMDVVGDKEEPCECVGFRPAPAQSAAPLCDECGASAAPFIPRWGMSFACVLPKGHEGDHQRGGNCFKHGKYVGGQCPKWPDCAPAVVEQPADLTGEADMWHEGSKSFYHVKIIRKLTPEEANFDPTGEDESNNLR